MKAACFFTDSYPITHQHKTLLVRCGFQSPATQEKIAIYSL